MAGAGVHGGGSDKGDQSFFVDGLDGDVAVGGKLRAGADNGVGEGAVDDDVQRAARGRLAGGSGGADRDQQQVFIGIGRHVQVAGGSDGGVVADYGIGAVVRHDHVEGAADRGAVRTGPDGSRDGEQLDIGFHRSILRVVRGTDVGLLRRRILDLFADDGLDVVVIDQQRQVEAHADLGGRDAERAGDHAGVGTAARIDGHAAVQIVALCVFAARGDVDIRRADIGPDLVVERDDGNGARHGSLGIGSRARDDRARDGLGVVVGAGQEVQQVDGLQQVAAGDLDLDRVAIAVAVLLQVHDGGIGILARLGGIGDQAVSAPGSLIVLDGHHALVGQHRQLVTGDAGVVADAGRDLIVADDHGEGRADADAGALGDADAARANGELALVRGRDFDVVAFDLGAVPHRSLGRGVADQHGDRARDGRLALAADRTRQRLRGHQAGIAPVRVLGQVCGDGDIALRLDAVIIGEALHFAGDVRGGLVAVHADGHAHGDGIAALGQRHGRAGAQGAEVAVVAGHDARAARGVDLAVDGGVRPVLADGNADSRGDLVLLVALLALLALLAALALLVLRAVGAQGLVAGLAALVARFLNVRITLGGVGLVLDILGIHGIAGKRLGVTGLARLVAVFVLVGFLIQLVVDASAGLIVVVVIVVIIVIVVVIVVVITIIIVTAGAVAVEGILGGLLGVLHLLGVALHIRAHGGGEGVGLVLAGAGGGDMGLAVFQRRVAHEVGDDLSIDDVHSHGRADRSAAADGEAAGLGQGLADLIRREQEIGIVDLRLNQDRFRSGRRYADLFYLLVVSVQRLLVFLLGLLPGGLGGLRVGLEGVAAGGVNGRVLADAGSDAAVQQADRRGGVQRNILGFAAVAGAVAGQRIAARRAGGLDIALGDGAHGQGAGFHGAVVAQLGFGLHIAVGQREGRADADGLALVVGCAGRRSDGRARAGGQLEVHLDGDGRIGRADIPRHEQCEPAVILPDADRARLIRAVLVLIGHGHGRGQLMQRVGNQFAVQLGRIDQLHLAAGYGVESEGVGLAARLRRGEAVHLGGALLHRLIGDGECRNVRFRHIEAIGGAFFSRRVVDHDDVLFDFRPALGRVLVLQRGDLLFLAVSGLGRLDGDHYEILVSELQAFPALYLYGNAAVVRRLDEIVQDLFELDVVDDVLVVGAEDLGRDDPELTVLINGKFVGLGFSVFVDEGVRDLLRKLIAFLGGQLDGLVAAVGRDFGLAADAGLDIVERRQELDGDDDFMIGLADVARRDEHNLAFALRFIRQVDGQLPALVLAVLVLVRIGHLRRQAVLFAGGQRDLVARTERNRAAFVCIDFEGVGLAAHGPGLGHLGLVRRRLFAHGLGLARVGAVAGVRLLGAARAVVGVGVALGVHGTGSDRNDLLFIFGFDDDIAAGLDIGGVLRKRPGDARDGGAGGAVDDGHGHAAGHAHVGRAGAGDGFGADDVLAGQVFRRQLHIQPVGQRVQRRGRQRQTGVLHGGHQLGLHRSGDVAGLHPGGELGNVHEPVGERGDGPVLEIGDDRFEFGLQGLLQLRLVQHDRRGETQALQPLIDLGDDRSLRLFLDGLQHAREDILQPGGEHGGIKVLAAHAVLDGLQHDADQFVLELGNHFLAQFRRVGLERRKAIGDRLPEHLNDGIPIAGTQRVIEVLPDDGSDDLLHFIGQLIRYAGDQILGRSDIGLQFGRDIGEAVELHQRLQAGIAHHVMGEILNDVGDRVADGIGARIGILGQAQFLHQVADQLPDQFFQLGLERVLFGFFRLALAAFVALAHEHRGAHVDGIIRFDADVADGGDVVDLDDVDGHADAHADIAAGGGGVGLDLGHGAVAGHHVHRAVHALFVDVVAVVAGKFIGMDSAHDDIAADAVVHRLVDGGLRGVLLDVQRQAGRDGHVALAGLSGLAVGRAAQHVAGVVVAAAVDVGQTRAAGNHAVGLAVGLLLVAAGRRGRGAGGAGGGDALERAEGIRADEHAVGSDALGELRDGAVVDDADIEGGAHAHLRTGGLGVGRDLVIGLAAGVDDRVLQIIRSALERGFAAHQDDVVGNAAHISGSAAAGDIQGQHRGDGDAARGARLGGHLVGHLLGGDDAEAVQRVDAIGVVEHGAVLHRRDGIRTGDGDGQARAHAGGGRLRGTGSVGQRAEVGIGVRADFQRAAHGDLGALIDFGIGLGCGDVHADRAADADVAFGIARGRLQRGVGLGRLGHDPDAFRRGDLAALDEGVVGAANHGHANGHAGADGGGVRIVGTQFELGGDGDGRRFSRAGGNDETIGSVGIPRAHHDRLAGLAVGAGRAGDDRLHGAALGAIALGGRHGGADGFAGIGERSGSRDGAVLHLGVRGDGQRLPGQRDGEADLGILQFVRIGQPPRIAIINVMGQRDIRALIAKEIVAGDTLRRDAGDLVALGDLRRVKREGNRIALVDLALGNRNQRCGRAVQTGDGMQHRIRLLLGHRSCDLDAVLALRLGDIVGHGKAVGLGSFVVGQLAGTSGGIGIAGLEVGIGHIAQVVSGGGLSLHGDLVTRLGFRGFRRERIV